MKFPGNLYKIGPTETARRELRALDRESDPDLRLSGLLSLGRRLLGRDETPAALRIFQIVKSESAETFPELADQAEREIAAIEGHGAFGQRAEFLSRQFFREASSPVGLIAMAGSQAVFGLTRAALLSRLTSSSAQLWTRGLGAHALASSGAYSLEAPSFVAFTRVARSAGGEKQDWSRLALGEEMAASFLTLGALKLGAWAGGSRPGLVTASTLGGILLGHRLEEWAGLRPPTDGTMLLTEGLTTLLHFKVAGRLLGSALGPRWAAFQRELHWRGESRGGLGWDLAPARQSLATASGPTSFQSPPILRIQSLGGEETILRGRLLSNAPKAVQKRVEEIKAGEEFSKNAVLHHLVAEMLGRGRQALSPAEKNFLLTIAHRLLDEYTKHPYGYNPAVKIFTLLEDFPGLRRLANVLTEKTNVDKRHALWMLEDYKRVFDDREADFFQGMDRAISQQIKEFAGKRGYPEPDDYMLNRVAADLKELAPSYDLVLAIAKGGLLSGGVAEFLDIPVKVIEVHAHNRGKPTSKFIDVVGAKEIAGKRILFVDKDIVSGATIQQSLKLIAPYRPSAVGVYLEYEILEPHTRPIVQELRDRGVAFHFPNEIEATPSSALALFHHAHEKLNTPLGRFRRASRELEDLLGEESRPYLEKEERAFFAMNPSVPGVLRIRTSMAMRLRNVVQGYQDALRFDPRLARNYALDLLRTNPAFPVGAVDELARARYYGKGIEAAERYGMLNVHGPHSYVAAFNTAQMTVKRGHELALIVGPEGFAYEPIFRDLGLETLVVKISEPDSAGKRSVEALDHLRHLRGKKVLVVEDDVRSSEPLSSLLAEIKSYRPYSVNLFLGLPAFRQKLENIPPGFKKVYVTEEYRKEHEVAFLNHLRKRESLFKDEMPGLDL